MRDVNASQPAAQGMGYYKYEIFLLHSLAIPDYHYRTLKLYQANITLSMFALDCKWLIKLVLFILKCANVFPEPFF